MKLKILFLFLFLFLVGCKTKHTTTTITQKDTIRLNKVVKIHPKQLNELVIENICDSLGNLKIINYTNTTGKVKTTLKSDNNSLKLEVDIDSLKQQWVKEYQSKEYTKEEVKVITERYIPKWMWYSLIYSILTTIWIFRKPLLKLITKI